MKSRKPIIEENQFGDVQGRWALETRFREFNPDVNKLTKDAGLEEGHYFRKWGIAPFYVPERKKREDDYDEM